MKIKHKSAIQQTALKRVSLELKINKISFFFKKKLCFNLFIFFK